MDRRERGPGISTRSDSLPSGTRQARAHLYSFKGLSEAFFLFPIRFCGGLRSERKPS